MAEKEKGNSVPDQMTVSDAVPVITNTTFSMRLKDALERLPVGKTLNVKTREDRQTITNVVALLKKKQALNLTTKIVSGRDEHGQFIIAITKGEPIGPVLPPTAEGAEVRQPLPA